MYSSTSTLGISDMGSPNPDRSRNALRSSMSTSNIGNWSSESTSFGQPQYVPGYLLSATNGVGGPSYPAPPLIPEPFSSKRGGPSSSTHGQFGADPFVSSFKASTSSKPVVADLDDENAPPTNSLLEGIATPDTKKMYRHSVAGGFYSSSPLASPGPQQQASSSTSSSSPSASTIIVFGFPYDLYSEVVKHFTSIGETTTVEPPPSNRNWITISYRNSWEAARAVRKNGDILALDGVSCMIGVKWADPTSAHDVSSHSSNETPSRTSFGANIGRPISIAPSSSAFKQNVGTPASFSTRGSDWAIPARVPDDKTKQEGGGGVIGRLSELVFGW